MIECPYCKNGASNIIFLGYCANCDKFFFFNFFRRKKNGIHK